MTENIEFNNVDQHIRCLAHIINLAAQEILKSLKIISNLSDDEFVDENDNNEQFRGITGLLHKVNNILINK